VAPARGKTIGGKPSEATWKGNAPAIRVVESLGRKAMFNVCAFPRPEYDLCVDIGTAHVHMHKRGSGLVVDEETVVALRGHRGKNPQVVAVGRAARAMLGKVGKEFEVVEPVHKGVIRDDLEARAMLAHLSRSAGLAASGWKPFSLRRALVVSAPLGATGPEKRAFAEAVEVLSAIRVDLVDEPLAAAIGADLPVTSSRGYVLLNLGCGITEIAVVCQGYVIRGASLRFGGNDLDEVIQRAIRLRHDFLVSADTARALKTHHFSASPPALALPVRVAGYSLRRRIPAVLELDAAFLHEPVMRALRPLIGLILDTVENSEPDLAEDFLDVGVVLTGGGALLKDLPQYISKESGMPVTVSKDPIRAVIKGSAALLEQADLRKECTTPLVIN
jgi:rod shape-determining protein MreB